MMSGGAAGRCATGGGVAAEGAAVGGAVLQPNSEPTIAAVDNSGRQDERPSAEKMWILVLEALGAGCLLVLIVWWTMFAGRRKGERHDGDDEAS